MNPFPNRPVLKVAVLGFVSSFLGVAAMGAETGSLDEHLEVFRPLLGKTWRGEFKESTPEKPLFDVARWERALNGKAVRQVHSVNEGVYGGETIIQWDNDKKTVVYHYFTTAGFSTTGTMQPDGKKFTALEQVHGSANGITDVRSTEELRADGSFLVKAEYLKNGEVAGTREVLYKEDSKAEVKFK